MKDVKRERFIRISELRTQKVLDALRSLSKCSSPASYAYTESEVQKIFSAIERELKVTRDSFVGLNRFSLADQDGPSFDSTEEA